MSNILNCELPDACADDNTREEPLFTPKEHASLWQQLYERDQPLLRSTLVLIVLMNINYGRYILYPFMIFSTWVHEMCHGMAAILVGGRISTLYIYADGSGLAYTSTSGEAWNVVFVSSAGYTGTALVGGILLLFRRTGVGPTIGIIGIAGALLFCCALYVRNLFALIWLPVMGLILGLCGWKLKKVYMGYLFAFLAATCSFNAVTSVHDLFAAGEFYVGGQPRYSDAHTVAEYALLPYWFWASCWFAFAIIMSLVGLLFAMDHKEQRVVDREAASTQARSNTANQEPSWASQGQLYTPTVY